MDAEVFQKFESVYRENNSYSWIIVLILSLILTLGLKFLIKKSVKRMRRIASRTNSIWDDVGLDVLDLIRPSFLFIHFLYVLVKPLEAPQTLEKGLLVVVVVISILQVWVAGQHVLKVWRQAVLNKRIEQDPSSAAALSLLYSALQTIFILTVILVGLSNLGVDIGALLAGLGVGGIAVALAAQNILGDLLASLSIVLDKPFVVGDYIVTGEHKGTIESIGIKTTRLRSLSGEQLILSNKDLLESRVRNYKRMQERRIVHQFGLSYETPSDKLQMISQWVRDFTEKHPLLRFDRCHFCQFGESALIFEWVFFVRDPDYILFMNTQEVVLLEIIRKFRQEKIDFAFPTRHIHVSPKQNVMNPLTES